MGERGRGREGFSVLCMLSQFQAVHFMREYNICNSIYFIIMCVQDLRLTKCLCTPNSHMHVYLFIHL